MPNIGIVVGTHAVLVVNCGLGPESGRRVQQTLRELAPEKKIILTFTHAHPEHAFGALGFRGQADIVLNR